MGIAEITISPSLG